MILTGSKCSGKMSFYERDNHLEHPRTETSDGAESTLGGTAHGSRSSRAAQPVRTAGETTLCSVSKGRRCCAGPWESRQEAGTSDKCGGTTPGDRTGKHDLCRVQLPASARSVG